MSRPFAGLQYKKNYRGVNMGLFQALFGRKEKKFTVADLKEIETVFEKKQARKAAGGDFFQQMREYNNLQKEMQVEKEDEIQEIIEKYGLNKSEDGDDDSMLDKMFMEHIAPKLFASKGNPQTTLPTGAEVTPPPAPKGNYSEEQIADMAEFILKKVPKKHRPLMKEQLKAMNETDMMNLKERMGAEE